MLSNRDCLYSANQGHQCVTMHGRRRGRLRTPCRWWEMEPLILGLFRSSWPLEASSLRGYSGRCARRHRGWGVKRSESEWRAWYASEPSQDVDVYFFPYYKNHIHSWTGFELCYNMRSLTTSSALLCVWPCLYVVNPTGSVAYLCAHVLCLCNLSAIYASCGYFFY